MIKNFPEKLSSALTIFLVFLSILMMAQHPGQSTHLAVIPGTEAEWTVANTGNQTPVLTGTPARPNSASSATVTIITPQYTYPVAISSDGTWISGSYFGGLVGYVWSAGTGFQQFGGNFYGITDNGKTTGTYENAAVTYNGSPVNTAGIFTPSTQQWSFLGMNPISPATFSSDYNSGWDITDDGTTVVGLQYEPGYVYKAFKWSQSGGYTMLGNGVGSGSRASGISNNGLTVFGWAEFPTASRTPAIWQNGQVYYVNNAQMGEAYGASPDGLKVTGSINNQGFIWTAQNTTLFSNTLWLGDLVPTTVLNNGEVFGYSNISFPPNPLARKAFVRDSTGTLMTFNDYAEARGLENAQQWYFYSINDASADGTKFIGGGKNPAGQNVTFLITFNLAPAIITVSPSSVSFGDVQNGTQSTARQLVMKNGGSGNITVNSVALGGTNVSQFQLIDNNTYPLALGYGDSAVVSVIFAPTTSGTKTATVDFSATNSSFQVQLDGNGVPGVGIGETENSSVSVWPNPAKENIKVTAGYPIEKAEIFNTMGEKMLTTPGNSANTMLIPLQGLCPGIYHVRITGSEGKSIVFRTFVRQ